MMRRRTVRVSVHLVCSGLLIALTGCQSSTDVTTFIQDFARQILAAYLL